MKTEIFTLSNAENFASELQANIAKRIELEEIVVVFSASYYDRMTEKHMGIIIYYS